MTSSSESGTNWINLTKKIAQAFEPRAAAYDQSGAFVEENYKELKEHRFFSAAIPTELGGGGASHQDICNIIRIIGHYCSSTALAFSMHQHLIAAAVWKYKHKGEGAPMLQKVADNQLVLVSTGARDWLGSNGEMKKVEGGYSFSAKKYFASQSESADMAVTSGPFQKENGEWVVLHFGIPISAEGVTVADDWDVLGMRATGSQTLHFTEVFIPDASISLERPKDAFHGVWNMVLGVALPIIMSAYLGIAEKAYDIGLEKGKKYARNKELLPFMVGKMYNTLLSARTQHKAMIDITNNLDFEPSEAITIDMLSYKTNISMATKEVVAGAMEAIGGQSFYKQNQLERLFRDIQASPFHPLPEMEQYQFTGKRIIGD